MKYEKLEKDLEVAYEQLKDREVNLQAVETALKANFIMEMLREYDLEEIMYELLKQELDIE